MASSSSSGRSIAIIGASSDRSKYGNKAVRAFRNQGYSVFPVHPSESEIEGLRAYSSIGDIPVTPDLASFYVPPSIGIRVIDEVAEKGIKTVWLNPGAGSPELVKRAEDLGLQAIEACSIVAHGDSPGNYPEE